MTYAPLRYLLLTACTMLFFSCKKESLNVIKSDVATEQQVAVSEYKVNAVVYKLDPVKNNSNNYEIAFWISADSDPATALKLEQDVNLSAQVRTGKKTSTQTFRLKKNSYVTRVFLRLPGAVSITGNSVSPSTYLGLPLYFNTTAKERTYQLSPVSVNGKGFIDAAGHPFIPWGVNYTNTNELRLIDDNWYDEKNWEIIKQDFREMKALGLNLIRIHLQYNRFMTDAETPDQRALARLAELIEFAGTYGLYLDITGLCSYIKEDSPAWYDQMNEEERWKTQSVFWKAVAAVGKNYNNVFAYNLMNEPVTPTKKTDIWLPGEDYGGYYFVQYITRTPRGRSWETVTRSWIETLKTAIRSEDSRTPLTVGFIALGVITKFNDLLDYNSAHLYPEEGKMNESFAFVNNNQTDRPLVIEETNWFAGFDNMENFITTTQSDNRTAGYLTHYHGETIKELNKKGDLGSAIQRDWYKLFCFDWSPIYRVPAYYE